MKERKKRLSRLASIIISILLIIIVALLVLVVINLVGSDYAIKYASGFEALVDDNERPALSREEDGTPVLTKADGKDFKVLHLTDIHIGGGILSQKQDKLALDAVYTIVSESMPDLIVITGDLAFPIPLFAPGTLNNKKSAMGIITLLEKMNIYWDVTFGNHDVEPVFSLTSKADLGEVYQNAQNSLFSCGPEDIYGVGNHTVKIRNADGSLNQVLYMIDSNDYESGSFNGPYDHIHADQVEWYANTVKSVAEYERDNNGDTRMYSEIPSMMFFHIPFKEYADAWEALYAPVDGKTYLEVEYLFGEAREGDVTKGEQAVFHGASTDKDIIFGKILELGSTKATFCGHDHINNFSVRYGGVMLNYGMAIDYLAYGQDYDFQRGGTDIMIADDGGFSVNKFLLKDIA